MSNVKTFSPGKSLNVLVIDDDDISRTALREVLEASGHHVTDLVSAVGAQELMAMKSFDAVVLDVMLPGLTGDKFARLLRRDKHGDRLAIILVSSAPQLNVQALANLSDADSALSKRDTRLNLNPTLFRAWRRRNPSVSMRPFAAFDHGRELRAPSQAASWRGV